MNFTEPFVAPRPRPTMLTILQYVVFGSVILYFGRQILVPLAFAMLISFVLYPICKWMEKKGAGRMTAIVISVGMLTMLLLLLVWVMFGQVSEFLKEWPALQPRIAAAALRVKEYLVTSFGISPEEQQRWLSGVFDYVANGSVSFISGTISFSATSLVLAILIPVYVVLILYYRTLWKDVLFRLFSGQAKESIERILTLTIDTYYNFIKGMGIVYLAVGVLNTLGLLALGIPNPLLFGITASILTFIPYVGIMVGALLPVTIAWAMHDSIWYPLGVVGVFAFVQYLEANLIFPLAVSNRLKVNTLAVLVAIFAGGILWGVSGMILFVPFVGIVKLIADHNPSLSILSTMLGTGQTQR